MVRHDSELEYALAECAYFTVNELIIFTAWTRKLFRSRLTCKSSEELHVI